MVRRLLILGFTMAHLAIASERPNILIIMVDDMGFSDFFCVNLAFATCSPKSHYWQNITLDRESGGN